MIDTDARAEQLAGRDIIDIAESGSTAERIGTASPALAKRTVTLDALVARANTGTVRVGPDTTIVFDEAGMIDHKRLDALTGLVGRSGAKLIAVGDGKQLPSIGPGGMFDRLTIHPDRRARRDPPHPRPRRAESVARTAQRRTGEAIAHYLHRGQLYFRDTRDDAGEAAVQHWHTLTQQHGIREVALIADSSNQEIDRLNARAQHLRVQHGKLGHTEIQLPHNTTGYAKVT